MSGLPSNGIGVLSQVGPKEEHTIGRGFGFGFAVSTGDGRMHYVSGLGF